MDFEDEMDSICAINPDFDGFYKISALLMLKR